MTEEYHTSCDIAQALEAMEGGSLISSFASKEMESKDVKSSLNHGWNAIDKFKEAENLAASTVDEIFYNAKAAQGSLYFNIFKNTDKAKKIFTALMKSSASTNHHDKNWYQEAKSSLQALKEKDPAVQKERVMKELQPELEKIHDAVKEAGQDTQKIIDFFYRNYPPIPLNDGTLRAKPMVSKLGDSKAIRKMIYSYHPDKINKSDIRYKVLCEEITKIFTKRAK
jgi:hypothetical protein